MTYYVNTSGRDLQFSYAGEKYTILAWTQVNLPDVLYDFIESNKIPLEIDYQRFIAESQSEHERLGHCNGPIMDAFIKTSMK